MTTRTSLFTSIALAAALLALGPAPRARACWDGHAATVGGVTFAMASGTEWSPERARMLATWLGRIDALLADGETVMVEHGYVSVCAAGGGCLEREWDERALSRLFLDVAKDVGASPAEIRAARRVEGRVRTVQVAALATREAADVLAARIDDDGVGSPGFYEAGGFPASNPTAHVLRATGARGETVYRVVVGAFTDAASAEAHRIELASALGFDQDPFVRVL
jgi:hypothetical protein